MLRRKVKGGTRNSRRDRLHLVFVTEEKKNSKSIRFQSPRAMGKGESYPVKPTKSLIKEHEKE